MKNHHHRITRRACLAGLSAGLAAGLLSLKPQPRASASETSAPFFTTRGAIIRPDDIRNWTWPAKAKAAHLTTLGTHMYPSEVAAFVATEPGQAFLEQCRQSGLAVEHELHAMADLLPRALFANNPECFRMNDKGDRVPDANVCVHSETALNIVCENALHYAKILRPTTGRYFYWIDDGQPMCACPACRGYSDSEQALILENRILKALRTQDPNATLAHLAYARTITPPKNVKPDPGIFLEFAPIERDTSRPLNDPSVPGHVRFLEQLDANLEVFGANGAQALEYWLDESLFAGWKRENLRAIPWKSDLFQQDIATYAARGIHNITTFAVYVDQTYVGKFGEPPLDEYGLRLETFRPA